MKKQLPSATAKTLIDLLHKRFEINMQRHKGVSWKDVEARLSKHPEKLWSLNEMERTGGEPDVTDFDKTTGEVTFTDCSPESPSGRRSFCYDQEGWESRKEARPANNVIDAAASMGIELLDEAAYRHLQSMGKFDAKTSSWILTPSSVRKLGGALFGDLRYGQVFIYHNGAQSYYAARGFRGSIKI